MPTMTGRLKQAFNDRGFTFIEAEDGPENPGADVFLHVQNLVAGQDQGLFLRGCTVEFQLEMVQRQDGPKPQARDVRLVQEAKPEEALTLAKEGVEGSVKFWDLTYGFLIDGESGEEVFVHKNSVKGHCLRPGDTVKFDVAVSGEKQQAANVEVVAWEETGDPYSDQLDMRGPGWAGRLAQLAEPENWNYSIRPKKDDFPVLRNYLKYTFLRLTELENHVMTSHDESRLAFNTGLVTPFQEEIFAVFDRKPEGSLGPEWVLMDFEKASWPAFLRHFGGRTPPLASYYSDPSELVYDTRSELVVNVEHVPHDPDRFSSGLQDLSPEDLAALVNAKAPEAIDRVRRNYKTAIPQFYRDGATGVGRMSMLLPVAMLRRDRVELALAVDRIESGVYLGRTVLHLDWAYNMARLLTRPDTDWLKP